MQVMPCCTAARRMARSSKKLSLPSGVFRPYAGVSTAILTFTKTNSGGTDFVWFYDVDADGWSLDDKRTALLAEEKLGPIPRQPPTADEDGKSNLPDVLTRWRQHSKAERERPRTAQSFCVSKADIEATGYRTFNRWRRIWWAEQNRRKRSLSACQ